MFQSNDPRDYTPDRRTTAWGAKCFFYILGICLFAGVVFGVVDWAGGWASVPAQVTSADNVRKQWGFAYEYDEKLQAAASQVCTMESGLRAATEQEERIQRRSQLLAYEQNYARIAADYNGKLRNAFEARWVKPSDVPDHAPTLSENKKKVCAP